MIPRHLHPAAWWGWAIGMAAAVSQTTNPLLLLLAVAVAALVVSARRGQWPWARAFRLYLYLGLFIIAIRIVLHVIVGLKVGEIVILPLPQADLPRWAAGINIGGDVRLEGLLAAVAESMRLAAMIACVGAANALANPKRLLRALPGALQEIGSAVVVSVTVAPQLAESVQRVRRARALRGASATGIRALPAVALPVLEDTLERSLRLAAAMDSRGYGRLAGASPALRRLSSGVNLLALLMIAVGLFGVLDATTPPWLGLPALLGGVVLACLGIFLGGRGLRRTTHRPDPWAGPEWLTVLCGAIPAAALIYTVRTTPDVLIMPFAPLGVPALPVLPVLALLCGALPAFLTPPPPRPAPRVPSAPGASRTGASMTQVSR